MLIEYCLLSDTMRSDCSINSNVIHFSTLVEPAKKSKVILKVQKNVAND